MKATLLISVLFLTVGSFIDCIDVYIPEHIQKCYRNNATDIQNNLNLPITMQVLIELLQKIELNQYLDMRVLSTSTLFRVKFDGIQRTYGSIETEHIVPAGLTGIHFNKFRLLMTYLLSGDEELFPNESLTIDEFCTLHFIISSSVQEWERGDEQRSCNQFASCDKTKCVQRQLVQGRQKSLCPIENGVVKTDWGDISAGHLIMAVSAALQEQQVKLMDIIYAVDEMNGQLHDLNSTKLFHDDEKVSNLWASTLAGDLGEVVAYQVLFTNNVVIGAEGQWNDSLLPRAYYLPDSIENHWEMTLAETLGGIDGVIIGSSVNEWTNKIGRLRLSQVLDMYYSSRGINFDAAYRACQRQEKIKTLIKTDELLSQTTAMAKLLQYKYISNHQEEWLPLSEEDIDNYSKAIVDKFIGDLDALTDLHSTSCEKKPHIPAADIFTVMDGTWTRNDGRRFISALIHAADVSLYGSRIGFINGNTGVWMTNVTHSIYQIFQDLARPDLQWPTSLQLSDSLATIVNYLQNKTIKECMDKYRTTRNSVIVVMGQTSTVNSVDLENSKSLVKTIKNINPSITILYVTIEANSVSFQPLTNNEYGNDVIIKIENSIETVVHSIANKLQAIPGQIVELHCDMEILEYEDYITPEITTIYEISHIVLQNLPGEIKVQFSGYEYGNLSICGSDKESQEYKQCQWIDENSVSVEFTTKAFCKHNFACNVLYKVFLHNSKNKCTDNDCRYPDQARIQIRTTLTSSCGTTETSFTIIMLIFVTKIFY